MRDLVLVFQQPINGRFAVHRLVNRLGHRLAVNVKECLVIQVVFGRHARVQPYATNDAKVLGGMARTEVPEPMI